MKETRNNILEVAGKSFATRGFQKTTMEGIARMANRGRRTLYTYFRNKKEIFSAVVEMEIDNIVDRLSSACNSGSDISSNLHHYAQVRTSSLTELLERSPMLRRSFLSRNIRSERLRDSLEKEEIKTLTDIIGTYHANELNNNCKDPAELAKIFHSMIKSADIMIGKQENSILINRYIELNCDIFVRGIRKTAE